MPKALWRRFGRFIVSGGQLLLVGVGAQVDTRLGWIVCAGLIAAISLVAWSMAYRHARAIDDMPTSRVASAAQGYVELVGRGRALGGTPLLATLSHLPCLWCRHLVERHRDDKWETESSGETDDSFILDDGSGECLIDPAGAEILTVHKETWSEGDHRYTEWRLLPGDALYALGQFRTRGGLDNGFDRDEAVKTLLAEWKKNPQDLLRRFDLDGNGEIDMREWELARAQARREVDDMQREAHSQSDLHMMQSPDDGRLYLLSNLPQHKLSRRFRWWAIAHVVIFFGALAGVSFAYRLTA